LESCFERLIAAVALYRPGPMDYIDQYVEGMMDSSKIEYDCPEEEEILKKTFGVMVYQEQLMQLAVKLAGYSMAEADILRKACGKKKIDLMNAEHERFIFGNKADYESEKAKHFIPGCVGNGIPEEKAEAVWEKMVKFASYAFNRSHAACYAYIAYITAYMSCHWPIHFYTAMLNIYRDDSNKFDEYLFQAKVRGINLSLPDINKSDVEFKADVRTNSILFGLSGIAKVKKAAEQIVENRKNDGSFKSFEDFYNRINRDKTVLNKSVLESLIFSGALNSFGYNHKQLMSFPTTYLKNCKKNIAQLAHLSVENLKLPVDDYDKDFLLKKEYDALGIYISGSPIEAVHSLAKELRSQDLKLLEKLTDDCVGKLLNVSGIIRNLKQRRTKNGEVMYTFSLASSSRKISCVVFPDIVSKKIFEIKEDEACLVNAKYAINKDFGNQLIVSDVKYIQELTSEMLATGLSITVSKQQEYRDLKAFLGKVSDGSLKIYIKDPNGRLSSDNFSINFSFELLAEIQKKFKQKQKN